MAIVQCRECGRHISDQARSCPGCGIQFGPPPLPEQPGFWSRDRGFFDFFVYGCAGLLLVIIVPLLLFLLMGLIG